MTHNDLRHRRGNRQKEGLGRYGDGEQVRAREWLATVTVRVIGQGVTGSQEKGYRGEIRSLLERGGTKEEISDKHEK